MLLSKSHPFQPKVSDFSFNNYLANHQQLAFYTLDLRLQEIILERLLKSQEPQDLTKVRLTLDIVALCPDVEILGVIDSFFLTALNTRSSDGDINPSLIKLRRVCQLNSGAKAFFKYASTKKVDYYTIKTLKEMIDRFSGCLISEAASVPSYLCHLPCHDEGGEALLLQKCQNPAFTGTSHVETISPTSSLPIWQPSNLKNLLTKNFSFKNMCILITDYFKSLPNANHLKQDIYDQFFNFLLCDPLTNDLNDREKSELLKLAVITTSHLYDPVPQHYSVADLKEMAHVAQELHADCGGEVLIAFCQGLFRKDGAPFDETIQALKLLHIFLQPDEKFGEVQTCLENFQKGSIPFSELMSYLEQIASRAAPPNDTTHDLQALMKRFKGDDPLVRFALESEKLKNIEKTYLQIETYCARWQSCRMSELINKANEIREKTSLDDADLAQLIAVGRLALRIKFFPIYLHPSQILTILGLLAHQKGCVAQVKTGEGKSMIVALMAFLLSMQKRDVHIISSSPSLSTRDQSKFSSFFKAFGITTSHICHADRRPEHFDAQMLYGTANDYEFAIMAEMLYFTKLFARPFANTQAIVDEVDNLTIDTALNGARFGYPAEISFNWIYLPIFKFLQQNIAKNEKHKIDSPSQIDKLRTYLQDYQGGQFKKHTETFSNDKLQKWLSAAYHALYELKINDNYIVEKGVNIKENLKQRIVIIDEGNTGKRNEGSRWQGGIHEFVEIKHHIQPKKEFITPIRMSHPVFYPFYSAIYGLSGTIGSESERGEIKIVYGIDSFDVPTHKPSLRHDAPPQILLDDSHLIAGILRKIAACRQQGRPILVLCKTIQGTLDLEKKLKDARIPHEILNETQQKKEEDILENAGLPGAVTIATNNAGRGTDIQLKGNSKANGGLHVLITFYPESLRVEEQARGRAGRQGEPGSSEILLSGQPLGQNEDLTNPNVQKRLIEKLDNGRKCRGNVMKQRKVCCAELERFCFKFTKEFYQRLEKFNALLNDKRFLESVARDLSNRLLSKPKPDFSILHVKDRPIAEEAFKLFQEKEVQPIQWVVLLGKIGKRVKEKTINEWAINFLAPVDEMIGGSTIQQFSSLQTWARNIYVNYFDQRVISEEEFFLIVMSYIGEEVIFAKINLELGSLKKDIKVLYQKFFVNWSNALDIHGAGIYDYLGHLLGTKLYHQPTKL